MTIDPTKLAKVKTAMDNRYENKQSNKKNDISGDFTSDSVSYPTVQAVKTFIDNQGYLTIHQDITGKEDSSNKVSSWSGTPSDTRYPSEKLVKDSLDNKISISQTNGLVKNDGTIDTNTYVTNSDLNSAIGSVQTSMSSIYQPKKVGSGKTYQNKNVVTDNSGNISVEDKPVIPTNVSDLTNDAGYLTQHQSLDSKTVTVEKQSTAESGYIATYVIKQGGTALSPKINIPKDYLVKSASIGTCSTADSPVTGYVVGDKYLDFVVNTKDNSETDEHLYILVSDLIDTYTAGNGLTLSNNEFSISNGDISLSMLTSGVQTSLGYADTFHSSPAAGITSTQISSWDSMASTGTNVEDIDARINQALDDLAELIYPTSSGS